MKRDVRRRQGLTLVEAAVLSSLLGVMLAVGVPAFLRALRTSKMSEAPLEIGRIYAAAAAYYASPQASASTPAPTTDPPPPAGGTRVHCLPRPAGPTPSQPSTTPARVEFAASDTPGSATWRAIGYEPSQPIRYRYSLLPADAGCDTLGQDSHGEVVLSVRAEGDLDGDAVLSLYERNATLRNGELTLEPLLVVHDRVE
jgi:Tfp pilus assembly protein PilE